MCSETDDHADASDVTAGLPAAAHSSRPEIISSRSAAVRGRAVIRHRSSWSRGKRLRGPQLGGRTVAQADERHDQARQGDDRAGYRPEGDAGHHAAAEDAQALQGENHPGEREQEPDAD